MAKKVKKGLKLNWKVAVIGVLVLGFIGMGAAFFWYKSNRDPQKYIVLAEKSLESRDYRQADSNYRKAFELSGHLDQIDILFKLADIAMIDDPGDPEAGIEPKEAEWRKAIGHFDKITALDPKNIDARLKILTYSYDIADLGRTEAWDRVKQISDELIVLYDEKGRDVTSYVIRARGRASLEMAIAGTSVDIQKDIDDARKFIGMLLEMEPDNYEALWYLAHTEILQGEIRNNQGILGAREEGIKTAEAIIQESIDLHSDNPDAYINMLKLRILSSGSGKTSADVKAAIIEEYELIKSKFPDNHESDYIMSAFYSRTPLDVDTALKVVNAAVEAAPDNYDYLFRASTIYLLKYTLEDETGDYLDKAIQLALQASKLPEAQETTGPRQARNANNIYILNNLLANCYSKKAQHSEGDAKQKALADLQGCIAALKKIVLVDENPVLIKWNGMYKYLSGDTQLGLKMLVEAENKFDMQNSTDPQLCYFLSSILTDDSVLGARQEYLGRAIENNIVFIGRPSAVLDYSDLLLSLQAPDNAITLVQRYEEVMGKSSRSREILIQAYIQANQFDKAEMIIDEYRPDSVKALQYSIDIATQRTLQNIQLLARQQLFNDPYAQNKIDSLKADIKDLRLRRLELVERLFNESPETAIRYRALTSVLIDAAAENELARVRQFVDKVLEKYPNDPSMLITKRRMSRSNPVEYDEELFREDQLAVLNTVEMDEFDRQVMLGKTYFTAHDAAKSKEHYTKALELKPENDSVITALFDVALADNDIETARSYLDEIRELNPDGCEGRFFQGRIALVSDDFATAIDLFKQCVEARPLFAVAYLNLSIAQAKSGNLEAAIESAKTAGKYAPTNSSIALNLATMLYTRNNNLGSSVTLAQRDETEQAILRAIKLNQGNIELQSIYAEYIADKDLGRALAMRQSIFRASPSKSNALLLARMALKNANDAFNETKKQAMYRIAEDALNNALTMAPNDSEVLDAYSEFYRISGQEERIEGLIGDNKQLLWKSYYRCSQYDKAKEVLMELLEAEPNRKEYLIGMIGIAIKQFDVPAVREYSNRLIAVDDSLDNKILKIKAFVEVGISSDIEEELKVLIEQNPDNIDLSLLNATVALREGYFAKAEDIARGIIAKHPNNNLAWRLKGKANYLRTNYEQALDDFKKCKALVDDTGIKIDLARTYDRLGRYDPAITELTLTLADDSTPEIAFHLLEEIYLRSLKFVPLREFYDQMVKRFPDAVYWQRRLGDLEMRLGNVKQAETIYKQAWDKSIDLGVYEPKAMIGYTKALLDQGHNAEMLSVLSKYVDTAYRVELFTIMGQTKQSMGNTEKAIEDFYVAMRECGLATDKIDFVVERFSGCFDKDTAVRLMRDYQKSAVDKINGYLVAYQLFFNYTSYSNAIEEIDKAIAETPPTDRRYRSLLIIKSNTLLYAYKKVPDKQYTQMAMKIYEELLERYPGDVNVLNNLAYLLAESNTDLQRAEEVAAMAYTVAPESGQIMDTYGYALIKNRKYEKAELLISRAIQTIELSETSAPSEIYEHYGLVLERLNKSEQARDAYQRALETGEELRNEKIAEIKDTIARLSKRVF
ncbi:MAG: tetratricopeptide repeat protein [Phycisphaerae bacterium]